MLRRLKVAASSWLGEVFSRSRAHVTSLLHLAIFGKGCLSQEANFFLWTAVGKREETNPVASTV